MTPNGAKIFPIRNIVDLLTLNLCSNDRHNSKKKETLTHGRMTSQSSHAALIKYGFCFTKETPRTENLDVKF